MKIEIIKCLQDNYSYLVINEENNSACVVDPSEADPIIDVIEKRKILNTGGGILNASKKFKKQIFFVLNPDTLWRKGYKNEFRKLEKVYKKI